MPTKVYNEPRTCTCGYKTTDPSNWGRHKKTCPLVPNEKDARIASLENDKIQLTSQLAAKDRQIDELIKAAKKPRTVNNTTTKYVVHQHVNCFGNESVAHITGQEMQKLMADPTNAVPQYIKLKHLRAPGGVNRNVRVPNQKRAMYQVVVEGPDGEKEWEHQARGDVLEKLYDEGSIQLEAEADEDTRVGFMFMDHQEKVRDSANGKSGDGGRRYKEQLDKIHCVISQ
jgi:hypothetical protein